MQGPQRSAQECNGEAESLKLVRALWRTHLDHCMAGYRFTSAQQVQAIQNEKLMEMGRQTRAPALSAGIGEDRRVAAELIVCHGRARTARTGAPAPGG